MSKQHTNFHTVECSFYMFVSSHTVSSWGGGISHVDKDADRECDLERKREWSDDYEDEMDCGKVCEHRSSSGLDLP